MSSALSSVRTKRTNPQPVHNSAPVQRGGQVPAPQTVGNRNIPAPSSVTSSSSFSPNNQQSNVGSVPTTGLSLHQIIDIYGKRILQLEAFMNQTKRSLESSVSLESNSSSGVSLQDIQALIDSKISIFQQKLEKEKYQSQNNLPNEIIQDFHSRFEMLANEIADLKDIVLQLQRYTMNVNKILVENSGLLEDRLNNEVIEDNFTLGNIPEMSEEQFQEEEEEKMYNVNRYGDESEQLELNN